MTRTTFKLSLHKADNLAFLYHALNTKYTALSGNVIQMPNICIYMDVTFCSVGLYTELQGTCIYS